MPRRWPILIATHHKTGTVWMQQTFKRIAHRLGLAFRNLEKDGAGTADIYLGPHGQFPDFLLRRDMRGLHLIRDPRDVVISGMHYHKKSSEAWLHEPREEFGGLSYQEKLNSLAPSEQMAFEMEQQGARTVGQMVGWDYSDHRFFNARYEDLIDDFTGHRFSVILSFLGFNAPEALVGIAAFKRSSLFSWKNRPPSHPHVRSGRARQWQSEFTRRDAEHFIRVMGESLITLKYERDHGWISSLRAVTTGAGHCPTSSTQGRA